MPLPAIDDIAAYGGFRYARGLPFDPRYERRLDDVSSALAVVAGMTATCPRVWGRIAWDPSGGGAATVIQSAAVWGAAVPTTAILFHGTADGSGFSVTWPSPIVDALASSQSLRLRFAWGNNMSGGGVVGVSLIGPNTMKIWLSSAAVTVDVFGI